MPARAGSAPPGLAFRDQAFVVFQAGDQWSFLNWLTSPGWRHCWVMVPCHFPRRGLMAQTFTMKLEPLRWGIHSAVWWETPENVAQAFLEAGATAILKVPVMTPPDGGRFIPRGVYSCVGVAKAVLGVGAWWVWTPRQLFAYLVSRGAKPVNMLGKLNGEDTWFHLRGTEATRA